MPRDPGSTGLGGAGFLVGRASAVHLRVLAVGLRVGGAPAGQPVELAAHLGGAALRRLGDLGHPLGRLVLRDLAQLGRLGARGLGRLLDGGVFHHLPASLHHLLVAFAACPRADDEADREPRDERGAVTHLAPLSRKYVTYNMTFPHNARVLIGYGSDKHGLPRPVNVTALPRRRDPYPRRARVSQSAARTAGNPQGLASCPIADAC